MIERISIKIASTQQIAGALSSDDRELYTYGFFILISKTVFGMDYNHKYLWCNHRRFISVELKLQNK